MNLTTLKQTWQDTPEYHQHIKDMFEQLVGNDERLSEHRKYITDNVYGFGENAFWWLWKLIMEQLPIESRMLEIGCFKGATLSVWQLIDPDCTVVGVSPLDSTGIGWEGDYKQMITDIHERYNQHQPYLIKGLSEHPPVIAEANDFALYDLVYIDGGHERRHIDNDLLHYAPMVKRGGYLVVDDCACELHMPWGFFQGIQDVTDGLIDYMATHGDEWGFICSVVHIKVYRKK